MIPARQPMLRRFFLLLPLAIFAVAFALFLAGLDPKRDPAALPSALAGRAAPALTLPPLAGSGSPGLGSEELTRPGVKLVNFFASWCLPCRAEHPALVRLARQTGVEIIGIDYKDEAQAARDFLQEFENPFSRIGVDSNGRAGIEWGISGVPESFVVDGRGVVRFHQPGPITTAAQEAAVAKALEAAKGTP